MDKFVTESIIKGNFAGPKSDTSALTSSFPLTYIYEAISTRSGSRDQENFKTFYDEAISNSQYSRSLNGLGVDHVHWNEPLDIFNLDYVDPDTGEFRYDLFNWELYTASANQILQDDPFTYSSPSTITPWSFIENNRSQTFVLTDHHGTQCRSTAVGSMFGVANKATIILTPPAVKLNAWDTKTSYQQYQLLAWHRSKLKTKTGYKRPTVVSRSQGSEVDLTHLYTVGGSKATIFITGSDILNKSFRINYFNRDFTFTSASGDTPSIERYVVEGNNTGSYRDGGDFSEHLLHYYTNSIDGLVEYINENYDIFYSQSLTLNFFNTDKTASFNYNDDNGFDTGLSLFNHCSGESYLILYSGSGYADPVSESFGFEGTSSIDPLPHQIIKIDINNAASTREIAGLLTESIKNDVNGFFIDDVNTIVPSDDSVNPKVTIYNNKGASLVDVKSQNFPARLKDFDLRAQYFATQTISSLNMYRLTSSFFDMNTGDVKLTSIFSASYDAGNDIFSIELLRPLETHFKCYSGSLDQVLGNNYPRGGNLYMSASCSREPEFAFEEFAPWGNPLSTYTPGHPPPFKAGYRAILPFDHFGIQNFYNRQLFSSLETQFSGSLSQTRTLKQGICQKDNSPDENFWDSIQTGFDGDTDFEILAPTMTDPPFYHSWEALAREGIIIVFSAGNNGHSPPMGKWDITNSGSDLILPFETSSFTSESYLIPTKDFPAYFYKSGSNFYYGKTRSGTGGIIEAGGLNIINDNPDISSQPIGPGIVRIIDDVITAAPINASISLYHKSSSLYNSFSSSVNYEYITASILPYASTTLEWGSWNDIFGDENLSQSESLAQVTTKYLTTQSNFVSLFGGSSSSSPRLAGLICLILQKYPWMQIKDVKQYLYDSCSKELFADNGTNYDDGTHKFYYRNRYDTEYYPSTHSLSFSSGSSVMSKFILGAGDSTQAITESKKIVTYEDPIGLKYAIIFSSSNAIYYNGSGLQYIPSEYTIIKTDVDASTDEAGAFDYGVRIVNALTQAIDQIPYATYSATTSDLDDGLIKIHPYPSGGTANIGFAITGGYSEYNYTQGIQQVTNSIHLTDPGNLAGNLFDMYSLTGSKGGAPANGGSNTITYNPFLQEASNLNVEGDVKFKGTKITSFKG